MGYFLAASPQNILLSPGQCSFMVDLLPPQHCQTNHAPPSGQWFTSFSAEYFLHLLAIYKFYVYTVYRFILATGQQSSVCFLWCKGMTIVPTDRKVWPVLHLWTLYSGFGTLKVSIWNSLVHLKSIFACSCRNYSVDGSVRPLRKAFPERFWPSGAGLHLRWIGESSGGREKS